MPWTKLKNIILIVLAVTDLCLLILVGSQTVQSSRLRSRAREDSIQFLRNRGVEVDERLIPQSIDLLPQTAALLQGGGTAESRGGEIYRYLNDNGVVQFHSDGTFSAQLDPAAFPLGEDRAAGCLALLERMGLEGTVLEEGEELLFRQTWKGAPLFTQQVVLVCQGDALAAIDPGRLLVGRPQEDPGRQTISVSTALIQLLNGVSALGDVCNRIDAIQPGYVTAVSLSGTAVLTPVWRVTTGTGSYQLDAVTGAVSRVS